MDAQIQTLKNQLLDTLHEYLDAQAVTSYSMTEISQFKQMLEQFISHMRLPHTSADTALQLVKQLVLQLNQLNQTCQYTLIAMDQRESICDLIDLTLLQAGHEFNQDVTFEWREW